MEYSVVKHVVARQIQYTYTVLLFRFGGGGQDTESVPLPAPGTESTTPGVHTVRKEATPVHTWHTETKTWVLFTSHQVFNSKILFGSSCEVLLPCYHLQKSLQNKMTIWHSAVPRCTLYFSQFTKHGDYASTHNPPCLWKCGTLSSTFSSHSPTCLFLKTKPPSLQLTFVVTSHCLKY